VHLKGEERDRFLKRFEYLPDAPGGPRVVTWFEPGKVYTERTRSGWSEIPGVVRVWDATTGEPAGKDHEYVAPATHPLGQTALTYLPDAAGGARILAYESRGVELWDAATGDTCGKRMWHDGYVTAASYVADAAGGPRVLTATGGKAAFRPGDDNSVRLWDATTGDPASEPMVHDDAVLGCRYMPRLWGEPHILSWSLRSVHVWSAVTFREVMPPTVVDHAIGGAPVLVEDDRRARLIVCTDRPQMFVLE
jgi:WD40 repeat protein